jgi:alpha-mannosidase
MAANGMFGAGKDGLINAPDPSRMYNLSMAEIAVFDIDCYSLLTDLNVIIDLAKVIMQSLKSHSNENASQRKFTCGNLR